MRKQIITAAAIAAITFTGAAYAGSGCGGWKSAKKDMKSEKADIVQTAIEAGQFSTLATALQEAGLIETLSGDGPFTVFAPTDEAFANLPDGALENLLKPENRDQLIAVLTYHVVPGKVKSKDVQTGQAATVGGPKLSLKADQNGVMVNQANVVTADIMASNGVIHVIDKVLLPQS